MGSANVWAVSGCLVKQSCQRAISTYFAPLTAAGSCLATLLVCQLGLSNRSKVESKVVSEALSQGTGGLKSIGVMLLALTIVVDM